MSKVRVLRDFEKLPFELKLELQQKYPHSFRKDLIHIVNHKGKKIKVLPYETSEKYYLIRINESYFFSNIEEESHFVQNKEVMDIEERINEELQKKTELENTELS